MTEPRTAATFDRILMEAALEAAAAADHRQSPNPMVGAVVATPAGEVVGVGTHWSAGEAHAEVAALAQAGLRARGATLYVTLEPCTHQGRTPPCVDAVVAAAPSRCVVAMVDPNPLVAGQGVERLRAAGIDVEVGLLEAEARRLNRFWLRHLACGRPFVTAKVAASLDGRVATRTGDSRWVTSADARRLGHLLRHRHDAIVVGAGTVLADDPLLTTRIDGDPRARQPRRIVVDTSLRIPPSARILRARAAEGATPPGRVTVATGPQPHPERARSLELQGAEILPLPLRAQRVDLEALLEHLGAEAVISVLAEGGPTLLGALFDGGQVDGVVAMLAPRVIGGVAAPAAVGGQGAAALAEAAALEEIEVGRAGGDIIVSGYCSTQRPRRPDQERSHSDGRPAPAR